MPPDWAARRSGADELVEGTPADHERERAACWGAKATIEGRVSVRRMPRCSLRPCIRRRQSRVAIYLLPLGLLDSVATPAGFVTFWTESHRRTLGKRQHTGTNPSYLQIICHARAGAQPIGMHPHPHACALQAPRDRTMWELATAHANHCSLECPPSPLPHVERSAPLRT
jgi:hypothetical protein